MYIKLKYIDRKPSGYLNLKDLKPLSVTTNVVGLQTDAVDVTETGLKSSGELGTS